MEIRLTIHDVVSILVLGEIVGGFFFAISRVQKETLGKFIAKIPVPQAILFLVAVPIAALVSLFAAALLARIFPPAFEIAKFIAVGVANTAIDWGVLNMLLVPLGLGTGLYALSKGTSFAIATLNSFFWNKFWTFDSGGFADIGEQVALFYLFTLIGFVINVGAATLLKVLGPKRKFWAGILAPGFATLLSAVWNFLSYRLIVFGG